MVRWLLVHETHTHILVDRDIRTIHQFWWHFICIHWWLRYLLQHLCSDGSKDFQHENDYLNCYCSGTLATANRAQLDSQSISNFYSWQWVCGSVCAHPSLQTRGDKGHSSCLEQWPAQKHFSFFLSFQKSDLHTCQPPAVPQVGRILRAEPSGRTVLRRRLPGSFWDVTLRKYKVACVNFQEIFLPFVFTPKGLKPHLSDCFSEQGVLVLSRIYR